MLKQPSFLFQAVISFLLTVKTLRHFPQVLRPIPIGEF